MQVVTFSTEATRNGESFLERLKNGDIVEATRPNKGREYTGDLEKMDLQRYKAFLTSYAYKDLFEDQEVSYDQY